MIFFARHGQTDWNLEGRIQGRTDIPLNGNGEKDAQKLVPQVQTILEKKPDIGVFISPLKRTHQTFEIINSECTLPKPDVDERIIEFNYGSWEGLTRPELMENFPDQYENREDDPWNFRVPGGENYAQLEQRVGAFVHSVDNDILVISHAGVFQALALIFNQVSQHLAPLLQVPQGRILTLENHDGFF